MSGTLPTTRAPATVEVASVSPTFISRSHSMKEQARRRGAGVQRWQLNFSYGTMEQSEYWDLSGFLDAQRGQYESFTLTLPATLTPYGTQGGTPLANGALAAGVSSAAIDGCSLSITNWGRRGDFFKFGGHSKVYRLTADTNSNGSGQVTLSFMPALLAAVADNEALTFASVPFTVRLLEDSGPALALQPPTQGTLSFSVIERY